MGTEQGHSPAWKHFDRLNPLTKPRRHLDTTTVLVLGLVGSWFGLAQGATSTSEYGILFLWMLAAWCSSIIWHELGHLIAARLAGLDPYVVLLGSGRSIARLRVGGISVDVGWFPGPALTLFGPKKRGHQRLRALAALAGGPAATLVLGGMALASALGGEAIPKGLASPLDAAAAVFDAIPGSSQAAAAFAISNGLVLVTTMLPRSRWATPGVGSSDGAAIVGLLARGSLPWNAAEFPAQRDFARHLALREYDAAEREARTLLEHEPGRWRLRLELATLLLWSRRYEDALQEFEALGVPRRSPDSDADPPSHCGALPGYARASLMAGTPRERLREAVRASAIVLARAPDHASALLTQSAALAALGKASAAERHMQPFERRRLPGWIEAETLAIRALIAQARGQTAAAAIARTQAEYLDPDCELLSIVRLGKTQGLEGSGTPGST